MQGSDIADESMNNSNDFTLTFGVIPYVLLDRRLVPPKGLDPDIGQLARLRHPGMETSFALLSQ